MTPKTHLFLLFSCILGSLVCFLLQKHFEFSAVFSSALLGFSISFLKLKNEKLTQELKNVVYAGSFAGMSGAPLLVNEWKSALMGFFTWLIYFALSKHYLGIGGKLGTSAFLGVCLFLFTKGVS